MNHLVKYYFLAVCVLFAACKSSDKKYPVGYEEGDEYFAVKPYFDHEWESKEFHLLVFARVTKVDGVVTDSVLKEWSRAYVDEIAAPFINADISDPKFLGKYNIDLINEPTQSTLIYEANDKDLYTQKVILTFNAINSRMTSLYMETKEDGMMNLEKKNLLYIPDQITQIVEFRKTALSKSEQTIITYKLL